MTPQRSNADCLRAQEAMSGLDRVWSRARTEGLDVAALIDLRGFSRQYAFARRDAEATRQSIELEQWAEVLYRQTRAHEARRDRRFVEKVIEGILRRMQRALEGTPPARQAA